MTPSPSLLLGKRILVTGGAGFLGIQVCRQLNEFAPAEVIVPRSAKHDLREPAVVRELLRSKQPQVIVHLAAVVGGIGANRENPGRYFYENAVMAIHLMEEARRAGVEKFVSVGTICSYPKHTPVPFQEDELWNGYPEETNAPYGLAKKMMLVQGQAYRQQYGFNAITLLPVNLYGPGDNFDPQTSHVIPALIKKAIEARDSGADYIDVWGSGSASREFLFVRDAARAIALATEHYNDPAPVNLGSGTEITIRTLVEMICDLCAFTGEIRWDATKPDGQPRRCLDTSRAKAAFGFEASTSFRDGLCETITWYEREQGGARVEGRGSRVESADSRGENRAARGEGHSDLNGNGNGHASAPHSIRSSPLATRNSPLPSHSPLATSHSPLARRALITGITGQDGSYLSELLLSKGYEVHGIVRRNSSITRNRLDQISGLTRDHLHYGDVTDAGSMMRLVLELEPDEIYNLAAQSHVRVSFDKPSYTVDVAAMGALNMLEAAKLLNKRHPVRFYQASTSEMFGGAPHTAPQSETTPFHPRSPYGCAKAFAHHQTVNYREAYDLFACCGLLFNHESPRRGESFVTRKITLAVGRIREGLQEKLYLGNLDAQRDWGFAGDFVEAMWRILQQEEPDDYVIATGETHSVREFLEVAFAHVDLDWQDYVELDERFYRPTEVDLLLGDASKAREQLGWQPQTSFDELARIMVDHDWHLAQQERRVREVQPLTR
ncbi:MAG TPA: GDP-mannose 4,6-dehydratase [Pirellulaceae bacterium]|nr:GDP-mannose 4,6-dehydratase [Pirellulaceae bacterium]